MAIMGKVLLTDANPMPGTGLDPQETLTFQGAEANSRTVQVKTSNMTGKP